MSGTVTLRNWVKSRNNAPARIVYSLATGFKGLSMPVLPWLHRPLYNLHRMGWGAAAALLRVCWYTPLFQSRLECPARRLYLYSGMPLVLGPVKIEIGAGTRVSGISTISGRSAGGMTPRLRIGSNCDIGWQTTIAVGTLVSIGDNVRIAGRAFLAGYPGHPLDAARRAAGEPDDDDQARDIILEDDVWLATGVTVCAGIRIGRGTVVAAGSVVTKDLPSGVLAGGAPARIIRPIHDAGVSGT
jgi:acetyltransferase-like isoleucine patch superfamily enzyme